MTINHQTMTIDSCLPGLFISHRDTPIPAGLVGSTIINIGSAPLQGQTAPRELIIDYRPNGLTDIKRLVLSFDDCGMYLEEDLTIAPSADESEE